MNEAADPATQRSRYRLRSPEGIRHASNTMNDNEKRTLTDATSDADPQNKGRMLTDADSEADRQKTKEPLPEPAPEKQLL